MGTPQPIDVRPVRFIVLQNGTWLVGSFEHPTLHWPALFIPSSQGGGGLMFLPVHDMHFTDTDTGAPWIAWGVLAESETLCRTYRENVTKHRAALAGLVTPDNGRKT